MKLSLSKRIENYLKKNGGWIHKGTISDLARQAGYSSENAGRRLRELCEAGIIEVKYEKGREAELAWYKYRGIEKTKLIPEYNPINNSMRLKEIKILV